MWIDFLGAEIHHHPGVGDRLVFGDSWNLSVSHHENGISTLLARFLTSLRHATIIFPGGRLPDLAGSRIVHQLFIAADSLSSCWMDHWHCELRIIETRRCVFRFQFVRRENVGRV